MSLTVSALVSAFSAGVATFFAPCAFPLLPGYVGYYATTVDGEMPFSGVAIRGVAGGVGILFAFGSIAVLIGVFGQSVLSHVYRIKPVVGLVLVIVGGLLVLDRLPDLHVALPKRRASIPGFVLFGSGYAVSATSCFAPVFFAVVLGSTTVSIEQTVASVTAFGLGLATPLTVMTVLVGVGLDIGSSAMTRHANQVYRLSGVLILLVGAWQFLTSAGFLQ